ncbi:hypothetical protein GH5_06019 [Leishmania sp. Ghana 2012 LV757]|uniref:hypothetical protein n=1 Tax=Leishmania sp. Ghana 2012 LV757 TaxID=2803181 RepID=UPI001B43B6B6|nr:hypothetical protein GH5_06019 [Leishmania sp. Ghana 2012 LV757]
MPSSLRKNLGRSPVDTQSRPSAVRAVADHATPSESGKDDAFFAGALDPVRAPFAQARCGNSDAVAVPGSSPGRPLSRSCDDGLGSTPPYVATAKRRGFAPFRPPSTFQATAAARFAVASRGGGSGGSGSGPSDNAVAPSTGSTSYKPSAFTSGRSPNTRLRQPFDGGAAGQSPSSSFQQQQAISGTSPPLHRGDPDGTIPCSTPTSAAAAGGGTGDGGAASSAAPFSSLASTMSVSGLSNRLRLSEGLSCLDYHPSFRALAIGSTRQIHVVEVIPTVGHDVGAAVSLHRQRQQQQAQASTNAATPSDSKRAHAALSAAAPPTFPTSPPPPLGSAPFLMRNTGVFGGLNKVECVAWYPDSEEASLAFIQPARTVTIFLDAIQFKADGTYLPQQWTRSQYKGKTLTSAMAAGSGSTAMAVVANLECISGGVTPAVSTTSLGVGSGLYTPASASLVSGYSFGGASISRGSTPHETNLSTPTSAGYSTTGSAARSLPHVVRNPKGPQAKELIELNIDITYMRVEKIVWDPHHPYTLALSSPATHFEVWQVPTDGWRVYAPQLVLRPPAHNTRSVVRDLAFSPSEPDLIVVVTECGNTGQVLLYDRRQVEAKRCFDISGPGLSVAFHPLFSDLLAVCFRREKAKPDTRISFLQMISSHAVAVPTTADSATAATAWLSEVSPVAAAAAPAAVVSSGPEEGPLAAMSVAPSAVTVTENVDVSFAANVVPASTSSYLTEQPYLRHIDNYACVSRMRWRPSSMGRLTEPKGHHYLSFKPSAQALIAARNSPNRTLPSAAGPFTWVDLLHSQLWFASAAMTTDTDLSIWDAANGFFPVCVVKHLVPRGDTTANESNDFVWLNELTVVTIFKSGDVVCTTFVNSLLEDSVMTSAERVQLREATPQQQQQLQWQRQQLDPNVRDELGELYSKRIAEEESCLAMLPAYVRDPYADLFTTFTVLPTASIVSDLFGHSYAIRNTNAALRQHYYQMIRRECGQLVRRLAMQVSKEAVLRQQWTNMRHQLPGTGPSTGPGMATSLAALQEQRSRRPRSPFMQTGGLRGRAGSSQGSCSTPPSPQYRVLTRRYSAASSPLSMGVRHAHAMPILGGSPSGGIAGPGGAGGGGIVADALALPQHPPWSLEDVSEAGMASSRLARERRRHAAKAGAGDSVGGASHHQHLSVHRDGGMADPLMEDPGVSGHISSSHPEVTNAEDGAAGVVGDIGRGSSRASSAAAWIGRLLGFSRRKRPSRHRPRDFGERSIFRSQGFLQADNRVAVPTSGYDDRGVSADVHDVAPDPGVVPSPNDVFTAASPPSHLRQTSPSSAGCGDGAKCLSGLGVAGSTATSPISVMHIENSDSSCGSPHQLAPAASAAHVHAAAARSFPACPSISPSPTSAVTSAFSTQQPRVGSGRGAPSSSSPLHMNSSVGPLPSAYGVFGIGEGSGGEGSNTAVAASGGSGGGGTASSCCTRSGVVFTQLFPLMTGCVSACSSGGGGGSCKARGQCGGSEGRRMTSLYTRNVKVSAPMAKAAPLSVAPASPDISSTLPAVATVLEHLPTALSSPAFYPGNAVAKPEAATASSLLLPVSTLDPVENGASGGAAVATPSSNTASQFMPAHAYLDSQRDVTAAVESFVLSDAACGWSYTEKQVEQAAFVRFALEWDMGYELALAMKALRHNRTDAEAAADALVEADAAMPQTAGPLPTVQPRGHARSQSASRDADGSSALQRSWWRSSSSGGGRHECEWNTQQQMRREPYRSRPGGTCGTSPVRFGAPSAHSTRVVDWGNGVPIPRHEEVDDKVAAMMEGNARICERVLHQRWETGGGSSAGCCAEANRCRPQGEGNSVVEVSGDTARDPRAQWWRAAAHAWRSHHVSFIISITAQQLEYAALMGDVQYSLVLYILFCLWWRLHSEIAEATYATALEARACLHRVGSGVNRDGVAGEGDGRCAAAPQQITSQGDTAHNRRVRPAALARGVASQGQEGNGEGGLDVSGASVDALLATAAPRVQNVSMGNAGRDNGSRGMRSGLHRSSNVKGSEDDEAVEDRKIPSPGKVEALRQLYLFFLRCPLMPLSTDSASRHLRQQPHPHLRPPASRGAHPCVTGGSADPADHAGAAGSPLTGPSSLAMPASGVGGPRLVGGSSVTGSLGTGVLSRASASSHSLPPRSHSNSSRRLNDAPPPPALIDSVGDSRFGGSYRASTSHLASLGGGGAAIAGYRGRATSPTPQALQRPDSSANGSRAGLRHGSTTGGTTLDARNVYVDVEGLRGVRLYSRSAEDLSATPDYCTPEEWKIRALQWLETYTADLYARQLYVPLNELLLVMPEIFREPTNPVLPRAADIAYEKQMTYVYCGTCSKAELWNRTQKDAIPAAVRLYDLVVRRGRHSSSSEEEGDEIDSDSGVNGATMATGADARRLRRRGRGEHHHATAAIRCGSVEYHRGDGGDSSSVATTPSVESPTASSLSVGADDNDDAGAKLAAEASTAHAGFDVDLSSDYSTDALHEAVPLEGAVAGREMKRSDISSYPSPTRGLHLAAGATAGHVALPSPEALSFQRRPSASASHSPLRGQHSRRIKRLRYGRSRRSIGNTIDGAPNSERNGDNADDGDELHLAGAAVDAAHHPERHTAVDSDECDGNPTPNNAACRRCHNRSAMTCVICEEVVEGIFFWLRSCGHGGHVHHVEEWLRYSQECPKCGISITQTWKGN